MKLELEQLLVGIVILVLLYYTFKHITLSRSYRVRPSLPWNNVLYGKANSRRNKGIPLPYPHLTGKGHRVPQGTPGWLI